MKQELKIYDLIRHNIIKKKLRAKGIILLFIIVICECKKIKKYSSFSRLMYFLFYVYIKINKYTENIHSSNSGALLNEYCMSDQILNGDTETYNSRNKWSSTTIHLFILCYSYFVCNVHYFNPRMI